MNKSYYVYILTNKPDGVLYVGATNDLSRRFFEHVNKLNPESFTAKYKLTKLVYYQEFNHVLEAIKAEKYLKNLSMIKKIKVINEFNNGWKDLARTE